MGRASLDLIIQGGGHTFEFGVRGLCRRQAKLDGHVGVQGEEYWLEGIVHRIRVDWGLVDAFFLPPAQENDDALVPERHVGQQG